MDARRVRLLAGAAIVVGLLGPVATGSVAAASCTLRAPATIPVGTAFAIDGAGFPASSSVDIEFTVQGGGSNSLSIQSTASGGFRIDLTPEAADVGTTTVVATAGSACSAKVVYRILGAGETVPPTTAPTTAPTPAAPGAGGAGAAGSSPPRTDTAIDTGTGTFGAPGGWLLAVVLLAIGAGGLIATRRTGRR